MSRVVVTAALPLDLREALGPGVEVVAPVGEKLTPEELRRALPGADALVPLLSDRVDDALLAAAPRLRLVANYAVGTDNIDVAAATRRGIYVTNTPDVLTEATADLTWALLLAAARRVAEGDRLVRGGSWSGWAPGQLLGAEVAGRTLGVIGFGRIGQAVARRGLGFGMTILYVDHAERGVPGATRVTLDELLPRADFLSLHVPLTPETRGLIGARELARLPRGAVVVNTARGACLDEDALAAAIERGHLLGAGLDVYVGEPAVSPRLRALPTCVLAPHIGSATTATRRRMAEMCAESVAAVLAGRRPPRLLNPEAEAQR